MVGCSPKKNGFYRSPRARPRALSARERRASLRPRCAPVVLQRRLATCRRQQFFLHQRRPRRRRASACRTASTKTAGPRRRWLLSLPPNNGPRRETTPEPRALSLPPSTTTSRVARVRVGSMNPSVTVVMTNERPSDPAPELRRVGSTNSRCRRSHDPLIIRRGRASFSAAAAPRPSCRRRRAGPAPARRA